MTGENVKPMLPWPPLPGQAIIKQVGEPFDLLFDMVLRFSDGGTAGYQEAFDFYAPVNQCECFRIQFFFLGHDLVFHLFGDADSVTWQRR